MADLTTKYMGLELKNPIIVGASNLVTDPENLKAIEKAGAAAVVYKSLFEEQIQLEELQFDEEMKEYNDRHAEMTSLFPTLKHAGPKEHLMKLREAKELLNIPVIASLNCVFEDTWFDYVKKIQETGVDGLELNLYAIHSDLTEEGNDIEMQQVELIKKLKKEITIPFSVKLSPFYTNPLNFIKKLDDAGAEAFVLFNKLFQPEIDLDKNQLIFPYNLSNSDENRLPMRYAGLLYGGIKGSISSNTGIYTGKDALKMILAGADTVQVVSTLYKNKINHIEIMLIEIEEYLKHKGYNSLNEIRGKLAKKNIKDPFAYKRAQYVDILMKSGEIFKSYSPI